MLGSFGGFGTGTGSSAFGQGRIIFILSTFAYKCSSLRRTGNLATKFNR